MVDPLPPRRFAVAAGIPGTGYDVFARQYARILTRDGVDLEVQNYASAIEHFDVLRDATSPVQAALTTFGFTQPSDAATLYSLVRRKLFLIGIFAATIIIVTASQADLILAY